jgi:hypothetical protein
MKHLFLLILVLLFLAPSLPAQADTPAYNFASAQGGKDIEVTPNGESQGSIFFYNIDGNQITHIVLEVSQAPANWQVAIQPPLGETQVEINGQVVTVSENLYVEPSEVLNQTVTDTPAGLVCISVPTRGYALAKEAKIIVRVPGTEKIGAKGDIVISATARWLGQSGAVAIQQNRDFNFSVEVVTEMTGIQEKILADTGWDIGKWLPVIIALAVVAIGVVLVFLLVRRRRV